MALLALLLPACGSNDPNGDAPPPSKQYGSFIQVTLAASDVLNTEQTWTGMVDINTDPSAAATSGCKAPTDGAAYCVIAYSKITLASAATLTAHGSRPLVLLATSSFDLEGTIDVSSGPGRSGAGAPPPGKCQGTAATGHSGGYGGSFGGKGGDGGKPLSGTGEAGGVATAPLGSIPKILQGGCPGGAGATDGGPGGAGGDGGGAVLIISPMIKVNGKIKASGAGGHGGGSSAAASGGGGGGSGGMIVLDGTIAAATPPAFEIWLFANGGGGGQGGTATGAGTGAGADGGESLAPMIAAPAGNDGNRSGGAGGIGSYGTSRTDGAPAGNAFNSGGGGAGGGGTGFIHMPSNAPAIAGAMFAPAPSST